MERPKILKWLLEQWGPHQKKLAQQQAPPTEYAHAPAQGTSPTSMQKLNLEAASAGQMMMQNHHEAAPFDEMMMPVNPWQPTGPMPVHENFMRDSSQHPAYYQQ